MDDLDDLTQSCEAASESLKLPSPSYEDVLLLIAQLRMECKDSVSLLKIQKAVQSYKRLIELKISHCELLRRQIEKMENKVTGLQKELSETKEVKSQLEHEKVEQEQELCNVRFVLRQEKEKRENADWLCEKNKDQLSRKEEQYNREVKVNQQLKNSLRILHMELKTIGNNLDQQRRDAHNGLIQRKGFLISSMGIASLSMISKPLANEKLEAAGRELVKEKRWNRPLLGAHSARPLLESSYIGIHNGSLLLNQRFIPSRDLVAPASNLWPSDESMRSLETRILLNLNLDSFELGSKNKSK